MNTVFVLTHVPNPRMNKRIDLLRTIGKVSVICVRRSNEDIWEPKFSDVPHFIHRADFPSSHHLIRRGLASLRFARVVLDKLKSEKPSIIYTGSLDNLVIARLYQFFHQKTKIILEIADVREAFLRNKKNNKWSLLSFVEKRLYCHVNLLVLTSELFYDKHYSRYFLKDRVLIIHNMPDISVFKNYIKKNSGDYTIGFIGGIRYIQQMKMLVDATEQTGIKLLFSGAAFSSEDHHIISEYCHDKPHVTFTGKYCYDQDIARLYGMVDCVYAVYDADNPNVCIALPNKYYEAIYCRLPIIVAKGTYLASMVIKNKVGVAVSHTDPEELVQALIDLADSHGNQQIPEENFHLAWKQEFEQVNHLSRLLRTWVKEDRDKQKIGML